MLPPRPPCSKDNTDANLRLDYTLGVVQLVELSWVCSFCADLRTRFACTYPMHARYACSLIRPPLNGSGDPWKRLDEHLTIPSGPRCPRSPLISLTQS